MSCSVFQNKQVLASYSFMNCELLLLLLKEIKFPLNLLLKLRAVWPTKSCLNQNG